MARERPIWLTVVWALWAVLVLPAAVLAPFAAFLYDDPDGSGFRIVVFFLWIVVPAMLVAAVLASWWQQRAGHPRIAAFLALYPLIHLALLAGSFVILAALS